MTTRLCLGLTALAALTLAHTTACSSSDDTDVGTGGSPAGGQAGETALPGGSGASGQAAASGAGGQVATAGAGGGDLAAGAPIPDSEIWSDTSASISVVDYFPMGGGPYWGFEATADQLTSAQLTALESVGLVAGVPEDEPLPACDVGRTTITVVDESGDEQTYTARMPSCGHDPVPNPAALAAFTATLGCPSSTFAASAPEDAPVIEPGLCKAVASAGTDQDAVWLTVPIDMARTCRIELSDGYSSTVVSIYDPTGTSVLATGTAPLDVEPSHALEHDFAAAGDYLIELRRPADEGLSALVRVVCPPVTSG